MAAAYADWGQVCRIGGNAFAALLPSISKETALELCGRVDERLKDIRNLSKFPTIALGCETKSSPDQSLPEVFRLAELAMYANKKNGRRKAPRSAQAAPDLSGRSVLSRSRAVLFPQEKKNQKCLFKSKL